MFSVKLFLSIVGLTLKRRTSALKAPEKTPKITIMEAEKLVHHVIYSKKPFAKTCLSMTWEALPPKIFQVKHQEVVVSAAAPTTTTKS